MPGQQTERDPLVGQTNPRGLAGRDLQGRAHPGAHLLGVGHQLVKPLQGSAFGLHHGVLEAQSLQGSQPVNDLLQCLQVGPGHHRVHGHVHAQSMKPQEGHHGLLVGPRGPSDLVVHGLIARVEGDLGIAQPGPMQGLQQPGVGEHAAVGYQPHGQPEQLCMLSPGRQLGAQGGLAAREDHHGAAQRGRCFNLGQDRGRLGAGGGAALAVAENAIVVASVTHLDQGAPRLNLGAQRLHSPAPSGGSMGWNASQPYCSGYSRHGPSHRLAMGHSRQGGPWALPSFNLYSV